MGRLDMLFPARPCLFFLANAHQIYTENAHRIPVFGIDLQRLTCKADSFLVKAEPYGVFRQNVIEVAIKRIRLEDLTNVLVEVIRVVAEEADGCQQTDSLTGLRIDFERFANLLLRLLVLL